MAEQFTTSDLITYVLAYIGQAVDSLREECSLSILEYRLLAYLSDHVDGARPMLLARTLDISPASVTVAISKLAGKGLIEQGNMEAGGQEARKSIITKAGIDASRDADIVLSIAHDEYFAPLPAHLKATVGIGSIITNQSSPELTRIRDGHFFTAFETLHAFLTVERLLTYSTHESGLSLTQFRILLEVSRQGEGALPGSLADALLLAPSSVTYALNGLEAGGLVARAQQGDDRRTSAVVATDEGARVFRHALGRVEGVFTTDIRSSTRRERDAYKDAAMIMVSSLRKRRRNKSRNSSASHPGG